VNALQSEEDSIIFPNCVGTSDMAHVCRKYPRYAFSRAFLARPTETAFVLMGDRENWAIGTNEFSGQFATSRNCLSLFLQCAEWCNPSHGQMPYKLTRDELYDCYRQQDIQTAVVFKDEKSDLFVAFLDRQQEREVIQLSDSFLVLSKLVEGVTSREELFRAVELKEDEVNRHLLILVERGIICPRTYQPYRYTKHELFVREELARLPKFPVPTFEGIHSTNVVIIVPGDILQVQVSGVGGSVHTTLQEALKSYRDRRFALMKILVPREIMKLFQSVRDKLDDVWSLRSTQVSSQELIALKVLVLRGEVWMSKDQLRFAFNNVIHLPGASKYCGKTAASFVTGPPRWCSQVWRSTPLDDDTYFLCDFYLQNCSKTLWELLDIFTFFEKKRLKTVYYAHEGFLEPLSHKWARYLSSSEYYELQRREGCRWTTEKIYARWTEIHQGFHVLVTSEKLDWELRKNVFIRRFGKYRESLLERRGYILELHDFLKVCKLKTPSLNLDDVQECHRRSIPVLLKRALLDETWEFSESAVVQKMALEMADGELQAIMEEMLTEEWVVPGPAHSIAPLEFEKDEVEESAEKSPREVADEQDSLKEQWGYSLQDSD